MPPLRKMVRVSLGVALAVAVVLAGCILLFLLLFGPEECAEDTRIISQNRLGDQIEMKEKSCDGGFTHWNITSLNLIEKQADRRGTFFSYDWEESDPTITWVNDHTVLVSMKKADDVHEKRERLGGLRITYRIGLVSH